MTSEQHQMSKCRSCKQTCQASEFGQKQRGGTYKTCKTCRDKITNEKEKRQAFIAQLNDMCDMKKYIESLPPDEKGKTLNKFKTIARLDDIYVNFNRELQSIKYASIVNENCVPIEDDEAFFHLCIRYEETQHAKDTSFLLQAYLKLEKVKHLMIDLEKKTNH